MTYVNLKFDQLTEEQHIYMLRKIVEISLKYMDGETFKTILLAQDNNYLLELINDLLKAGELSG